MLKFLCDKLISLASHKSISGDPQNGCVVTLMTTAVPFEAVTFIHVHVHVHEIDDFHMTQGYFYDIYHAIPVL